MCAKKTLPGQKNSMRKKKK